GIRPRLVRRRLHDEPPAGRRHRRAGLGRLRLRRGAARPGAPRAGAAAPTAPLLLEEREVGAPARAAGPPRARRLGELRVPQLRRAVAGAAVRRRLSWEVATVTGLRDETTQVRSLVLAVPGWEPHSAGQHVDVRLTAEDGYQAQRSYSIASAPENPGLELTIEKIDDGEVSPYLTDGVMTGDQFELRGPIGGYFVWDGSSPNPVVLIGGGSGLVPLMAMLRHRKAIGSNDDARLLLSVRTLDDELYRSELDELRDSVDVKITITRGQPPPDWDGFTGRIDHDKIVALGPDPAQKPDIYICGPTPFVEAAARLLVEIGHGPAKVYNERFGPTGSC